MGREGMEVSWKALAGSRPQCEVFQAQIRAHRPDSWEPLLFHCDPRARDAHPRMVQEEEKPHHHALARAHQGTLRSHRNAAG